MITWLRLFPLQFVFGRLDDEGDWLMQSFSAEDLMLFNRLGVMVRWYFFEKDGEIRYRCVG